MQVPPLGRGQRGRTSTKFYHDAHNNEEALKRIREEDKRQAEQQDRQDELAQRQLEVALELQHQEYTRKVEQKVAQSKEEKRRVEILEDRILLGNTARSSYRIGDINVSGLTMLQRIETLEKVCNFLDGPLDLSTRLTKLETWVVDGVWDESVDYLSCSLVEFQFGGKDELPDPELHVAKVALRRWTFRIRAIEDRLNMPHHQLLCSAWIYGQLLQRSVALEDVCGLPIGKGKLGLFARLTVLEEHLNNNRFPHHHPRPAFLEDDPGRSLFEDDSDAPGFQRRRLGVVFFYSWSQYTLTLLVGCVV
jgi:hypothetical protein